MKKLLTLVSLSVVTILTAPAYTIDEILAQGDFMILTMEGNPLLSNYFLKGNDVYESYGVKLERVPGDNTKLRMRGIHGTLDFEFTMKDNYKSWKTTSDGTLLYVLDDVPNYAGELYGSSEWYLNSYNLIYSQSTGKITGTQIPRQGTSYFILKIDEDEEGNIYFHDVSFTSKRQGWTTTYVENELGEPLLLYTPASINSYAGQADYYMDPYDLYYWHIYFRPQKTNAIVQDNYVSAYDLYPNSTLTFSAVDNIAREYPAYVDFNQSKGVFSIINLGNNGYAVDRNHNTVPITGTIDKESKTVIFDKNQYAKWSTRSYDGYNLTHPFQIERFEEDPDKEVMDTLWGTYTERLDLHHNDAAHSWIETNKIGHTPNRGKRLTYENEVTISLEPYTYYSNRLYMDGQVANWLGSYHNTKIIAADEYTLDVDLNLNALKWNPTQGVFIEGDIKTNKNDKYVDHYEIMLLQGNYEHIEQAGFAEHLCTEMGHKKAVCVIKDASDAVTSDWSTLPDWPVDEMSVKGVSKDYKFSKLITPEELQHTPSSGAYTAYIRAVYTPESKLAPTFHSLETILVDKPTSVDEMTVPTVSVRAEAGQIVISGSDVEASVYTPSGALVYQGLSREIPVAAGLYIVRVGSTSAKVLVK